MKRPETMAGFKQALLTAFLLTRCALAALPTTFYTTSYILSLTISSDTTVGSNVTAKAIIDLTCVEATSSLTFHWGSNLLPSPPTTSDIVLQDSDDVNMNFTLTKNDTSETVTLNLTSSDTAFSEESEYKLTVNYQITVVEDLKGLFFRNYSNSDGTNSSIIATHVWPSHARDVLPCLDEPQYNATWTLKITRPASWGIATSFNFTANKTDSSTVTDTFKATTPLPTSALSFFLCSNMTVTNYTRGQYSTNISFWAGQDLTGTTALTNNMTYLAEIFYLIEDTLGTNFSLTSSLMNIVIVPNLEATFSGLGIVYIREDAYYGSYSNAQAEGLFITRVVPVLRQMLKQYAGFSTWPQTWSDAWITDAVIRYLEQVVVVQKGLPFDYSTHLEVVDRQTALRLDTLGSDPLQDTSLDVDSSSALQASITDPLRRIKGAVVINMLDLSLPPGIVLEAIKTLLKEQKGSSINTTTFSTIIRNTTLNSGSYLSNSTQEALMYLPLWFNTSGYPLINVTDASVGEPAIVRLLMLQFCGASSCSSSLPGWYVSVTLGSETDPQYHVVRQDTWVMNSSATSASLDISSGDWLVSNMKAAGYYRASYNSTLWMRAVAAVAECTNSPPGRSQLVDDAFALSAAGLLDYNTTLSLAVANVRERLYSNWYPVHAGLWDIRDKLWDTNFYSTFKTYTAALLKDVHALLAAGTLDPFEQARIHSLFLDGFCEMNIGNYRSQAMGNLTSLLRGELPSTVYSSSYDAVACCGAYYNNSLIAGDLWDNVATFTASHYTKHYSAVALGCLPNYTDVSSLFPVMIESSVQHNAYVTTVLMNLAESHPTNLSNDLSSVAGDLESKLGAAPVALAVLKAGKKLNSTQATALSTELNGTSVDDVIKHAGYKVVLAATLRDTWLSTYNSSLTSALTANIVSAVYSHAATTGQSHLILSLFTVALLTKTPF